jgi:hypothetical protein
MGQRPGYPGSAHRPSPEDALEHFHL